MTSIKQKQNLYDVGSSVFGTLFPKDTSQAAIFVESAKKELSVEDFRKSLSEVGIQGLAYQKSNGDNFLCNLFSTGRSVKDRYKDEVAREILQIAMEEEKKHTKEEHSTLLLLQNNNGNTPLMVCCENYDGHQDTVKLLIGYQPEAVFIQNKNLKIVVPGKKEREHVGKFPIHAVLGRSLERKHGGVDNCEILRMLLEKYPSPECYTCCTPIPEDGSRWEYQIDDIFGTTLLQDLLPLNKNGKYWNHGGFNKLGKFFKMIPKIFKVELYRSPYRSETLIEEAIAVHYKNRTAPWKWFDDFKDVSIPEFKPEFSKGTLLNSEKSILKWNENIISINKEPVMMYVGKSFLHCLVENIDEECLGVAATAALDAMLKIKSISDSCMTVDDNNKYPIDILLEKCNQLELSKFSKSYAKELIQKLLTRMTLSWFKSLTETQIQQYNKIFFDDILSYEKSFIKRETIEQNLWRPPTKFQDQMENVKGICVLCTGLGILGGGIFLITNGVMLVGYLVSFFQESSLGTFDANLYSGTMFLTSVGIALLLKRMVPSSKKKGIAELNKATEMWNKVKDLQLPTESAEVLYGDGSVWKKTNDPLYVSLRPKEGQDEEDKKKKQLTVRSGPLKPYPGARTLISPITKTECIAYSCYLDATYEEKRATDKWQKSSTQMAEVTRQLPLLLQGVLIGGRLSLNGCCSYCQTVEKMDPKDWYANVTEVHTSGEDNLKQLVTLPWGENGSLLSSNETFEDAWGTDTRNHAVRVREYVLKPTSRASILSHAKWNSCWNIPVIDVDFRAPYFGRIEIQQQGDEHTDAKALSACFRTFDSKVESAKKFLDRELPAMTVGGVVIAAGLMYMSFRQSISQ